MSRYTQLIREEPEEAASADSLGASEALQGIQMTPPIPEVEESVVELGPGRG